MPGADSRRSSRVWMRSSSILMPGSTRGCCESLYTHSTSRDVHKLHRGLAASQRVLRERQVVQASHARRRVGGLVAGSRRASLGSAAAGDAVSLSMSIWLMKCPLVFSMI